MIEGHILLLHLFFLVSPYGYSYKGESGDNRIGVVRVVVVEVAIIVDIVKVGRRRNIRRSFRIYPLCKSSH